MMSRPHSLLSDEVSDFFSSVASAEFASGASGDVFRTFSFGWSSVSGDEGAFFLPAMDGKK